MKTLEKIRLASLGLLLITVAINTWLTYGNMGLRKRLFAAEIEVHAAVADLAARSAQLRQKSADLEADADALNVLSEKLNAALAGESSACQVIHQPKQGCPAGYVREAEPRFTERDGSKEFACRSDDVRKRSCIDRIKPGESVQMKMMIEIEPPPPPPSPRS